MARPCRLLIAVVLLPIVCSGARSAARAGELSGEEKKWVRECVKRLEANSPDVRRSAEKALVEMGIDVVPALVSNLKDVRSRAARSAVDRVLQGLGRDRAVEALIRLRPSLRSADAKRVDALLEALGSMVVAGEATLAPLRPATDLAWQRVPLGAEYEITTALPAALGLARYAVRHLGDGSELDVDADGDGTYETRVDALEPRVIRAGPRSRPRSLLIYEKRDIWFASSAALLRGEIEETAIELLDADADGRFDGDRDYVRVGEGAFTRLSPARRVVTGGGLRSFDVVEEGGKRSLRVTALPVKGSPTAEQRRALRWLNEYRSGVGLPPLPFDPARSRACVLHARYLVLNADKDLSGGNAHHEDQGAEGYTPEGASAGGSSAVVKGDLTTGMPLISRTMLHRIHYLSPSSETAGLGSYRRGRHEWTVVWTGSGSATETGEVVVVPGVGQERVPRRGSGEWPPPDDAPEYYEQARGHPVSVTYSPLPYTDVKIELYRDGYATPVAGRLFSPEQPIARSHAGNAGTAFFMPSRPLRQRTYYWAVFTARRGAATVRYVWAFMTG